MENLEKKDRIVGEHINLNEKDIFSTLSEEKLRNDGGSMLEQRKDIIENLNLAEVSQGKKEALLEFAPSNKILNEIRNVKSITGLEKISDWKFLNTDVKTDILQRLDISIPNNALSKISYKLIPGEKDKWLDDKFEEYIKQLTDRYEISTKSEI